MLHKQTFALLTCLVALLCCQPIAGQQPAASTLAHVHYTTEDSLHVVNMLTQAQQTDCKDVNTLFFARQFIGAPYVAHTLEVCDPERLVVNLRQFDCTTFLETSIALWLTYKQGSSSFEAFTKQLERIRYQDGRMNGYPSRLHYFSQWIDSNEAQGLVKEVTNNYVHTTPQHLNIYYMSTKPQLYKILKANPNFVPEIKASEQRYKGRTVRYIPKSELNKSKQALHCIEEGDIVVFVTKKAGLDTSHLSFATWHKDGKLHALNASSLRKAVVDEHKSLYDYLQAQPHVIGIRVVKLMP